MRNEFVKTLSLFIPCLTLCLLLSATVQVNSSKKPSSSIHIEELAPWR